METIRNSRPNSVHPPRSTVRAGKLGERVRPRQILSLLAIALAAFAAFLLLPTAREPVPDPLLPKSKLATQRIQVGEHAATAPQPSQIVERKNRRNTTPVNEEVTAP